ncbi:hypothetical protein T492DRAFT_153833 [Pavlovales sp. CCMP2436]|nr:hypothetical protein T492DRAFT_153833 [Pavlovales sp. CCMP2436]
MRRGGTEYRGVYARPDRGVYTFQGVHTRPIRGVFTLATGSLIESTVDSIECARLLVAARMRLRRERGSDPCLPGLLCDLRPENKVNEGSRRIACLRSGTEPRAKHRRRCDAGATCKRFFSFLFPPYSRLCTNRSLGTGTMSTSQHHATDRNRRRTKVKNGSRVPLALEGCARGIGLGRRVILFFYYYYYFLFGFVGRIWNSVV